MAEEFIINSSAIEDKINQLLPSQGGFGAGVDFSASTMVIPIIDLTESASGSILRQDLQTALDLNVTAFDINGSSNTTIISTTGYFRIFGLISIDKTTSGGSCNINITDGTTTKVIFNCNAGNQSTAVGTIPPITFDFIVKLTAGDTLRGTWSTASSGRLTGVAKQVADINGNLT